MTTRSLTYLSDFVVDDQAQAALRVFFFDEARYPPRGTRDSSPPIESERNELSRLYRNSFRLSLFSSPFLSFFLNDYSRIATQIHEKSKRYDETIRRIAIVVVDNENFLVYRTSRNV